MQDGLQIGEIATRSGVSIDTIRYYERRRLLPAAARTPAGYRLFTTEAVDRVLFIKQAKELGFSLDEIGTLLTNEGMNDCRRVHDLLEVKLSELDRRLKSMNAFRGKLLHFLTECEEQLGKHGASAECPVVIELAQVERR